MTPSYAIRNGHVRYRYYVCCGAQKRGWGSCPSKSVPAPEIERLVVEQVRRRLRDLASTAKEGGGCAAAVPAFQVLEPTLSEREQASLVRGLVQRIDYDGLRHKVSMELSLDQFEGLVTRLRGQRGKERS
jgi:hypothetical protein